MDKYYANDNFTKYFCVHRDTLNKLSLKIGIGNDHESAKENLILTPFNQTSNDMDIFNWLNDQGISEITWEQVWPDIPDLIQKSI